VAETGPSGWLDAVRRVLEHVRASDASEVEIAADGFRLRLVRRPGRHVLQAGALLASTGHGATATAAAPVDGIPLAAPLTGVFYRTSTPGGPPFVEVGDTVEAGAVVGLIETMKIFNEVLAERGGRIAAILAESGQLVHAGDALMTIEDAAGSGGGQGAS
jgi:acetyl-CoA carboxylase biotin carboxyl carrier protein